MEQGEAEKTIIEQCLRDGLPLPQKIQNAPSIPFGLEVFYTAFLDLSSCRGIGWGPGSIPWTAISEYARLFDFDEELTEELFYFVQKLDEAYLRYTNKEMKAKHGSKSRHPNLPPKTKANR